MLYVISDIIFANHRTGIGHPEQPARSLIINHALEVAGLKYSANTLLPRPAKESEVLFCHTSDYFQLVQREVATLVGSQDCIALSTGDAVISEHSFETALYAAGGVLTGIDQVMGTNASKVFCLVRPPGHHACSSRGMGFCIFNNVAIGARYAQQKYGLEKILIADWDVHHGNGTQEIFYSDSTVFYFSTHEKGLYPNTGAADELGEGEGKGFTFNCPILPGPQSRIEVLHAFETNLKEQMKSFRPDLVMISAGFDAHHADPLGHFNLTDEDFAALTRVMTEIADEYCEGRLVSVLEGGYNLHALASASVKHAWVLDER